MSFVDEFGLEDEVDRLVDDFELNWSQGQPVSIESLLPDCEPARSLALWELIQTDMELRLKAGQPARAESYLERFPELSDDQSRVVDLIDAEFAIRSRREPGLKAEEYCKRFPDLTLSFLDRVNEQIGLKNSDGVRYHLKQPFGEGGLGKVWRAYDEEFDRYVALKEIRQRHAGNSVYRMRFEQEAVVTGRLQHPGIVPVYSRGKYSDGRPYYTMQLIEGISLSESISGFHKGVGIDQSLGQRRLLSQLIDVCETAHYAHQNRIVHRDIKPNNIMLSNDGGTFLIDWGLAKVTGSEESIIQPGNDEVARPHPSGSLSTKLGRAIGSPAYMSPEQARGQHDQVDERTDVYSLGATLFTILTNQPPYVGSDTESVISQVAEGGAPAANDIVSGIPAALVAICRKAMACNKTDRYESAKAMAIDIELYLADLPIRSHTESLWERSNRLARKYHRMARIAAFVAVAISAMSVAWAVHASRLRTKSEQSAMVANEALKEKEQSAMVANEALQKKEQVANVLKALLSRPAREDSGTPVTISFSQAEKQASEFSDPDESATWLSQIATTYGDLGLDDDAIRTANRAMRVGTSEEILLEAQYTKAFALYRLGQVEAALELFTDIHQRRVQLLGETDTATVDALYATGLSYMELDHHLDERPFGKAIKILEETLRLREMTVGLNDLSTLDTKCRLGIAHIENKNTDVGLKLIQSALRGMNEASAAGDENSSGASLRGLLATLRSIRPDDDSQEEVTKEILQVIYSLAVAHRSKGELPEYSEALSELFTIKSEIYGERDPGTLASMGLLAESYKLNGDNSKAIELLEEYARLAEGREDANVMAALDFLADCQVVAGNFARSLELQKYIVGVATRNKWKESDPSMWNLAYIGLGKMFVVVGNLDEALPINKSVYEWVRANDYPAHFVGAPGILARNLMRMKRFDEAREVLEESSSAIDLAAEERLKFVVLRDWLLGQSLLGLGDKDAALTKLKASRSGFSEENRQDEFMRAHIDLLCLLCRNDQSQIHDQLKEQFRLMSEAIPHVDCEQLYLVTGEAERLVEHYEQRNDLELAKEWERKLRQVRELVSNRTTRPGQ